MKRRVNLSKLICDICGTSYPDTSTQCPICGCVRPVESATVNDSDSDKSGYTYVKGGRFSKSNVKKRNTSSGNSNDRHSGTVYSKPAVSWKVAPLFVILVVLFLIVACMIGFIVINFLGDNTDGGSLADGTSQTDKTERPCTGVTLSKTSLNFSIVGEQFILKTICSPTNTTDPIKYSSSDEAVVTVSADGTVTCVGAGEAVVYVYCGEQKDECMVECVLEEMTQPPTETEPQEAVVVKLSRENITDANFPGYSWDLYEPCGIKAEELTWVSENPTVATVSPKGVVKAVAEGSSVIRVYYNGEEVACCYITCDFSQQEDTPQEITGNFAPYIPVYGLFLPYEEDRGCYSATLGMNEWINIVLRDPDNPQNEVKVAWTIVEGDCRLDSDGAGLTATSARNCKIMAEYNGQTFYILIY